MIYDTFNPVFTRESLITMMDSIKSEEQFWFFFDLLDTCWSLDLIDYRDRSRFKSASYQVYQPL